MNVDDVSVTGSDPAVAPGAPVLLVTQIFPPAVGGSGVLLENVYARLRARVTVLTDRASCPGTEDIRGSLRIHRTDMRGDFWGVVHPSALMQHVRVARTIRSLAGAGDVVHCGRAQPEGLAALAAGLAPRGPRFLFWAHGEEISTAQTSRELNWVMRRVYAAAAAAIANSRNTAALLVAAGMASEKIDVVYPGVDTDRFNPQVDTSWVRRRFAPNGELLFVTVGRLQPRKGHDHALAALGTLRERLPPFRYVIVGDGPLRPSLESMARDCGIRERVSFVGEASSEELPGYFAACDIFIHPNRVIDGHDFEGFGIVFLEAAACGRPTIGGATGGVSEALEDGVTGLLVSGTDTSELAAAVARLAQSPDLRARFGHAGRDRVTRLFTWEAAARSVERIHARLTG